MSTTIRRSWFYGLRQDVELSPIQCIYSSLFSGNRSNLDADRQDGLRRLVRQSIGAAGRGARKVDPAGRGSVHLRRHINRSASGNPIECVQYEPVRGTSGPMNQARSRSARCGQGDGSGPRVLKRSGPLTPSGRSAADRARGLGRRDAEGEALLPARRHGSQGDGETSRQGGCLSINRARW